jgi:hypothetical protein
MDNISNRESYTQRFRNHIRQVMTRLTKHFKRPQTPLTASTPLSTSISNTSVETIQITDLTKASKFPNQRRSVNKEAVEV